MDPSANNYDITATTDDGSCEYTVTFRVDMNAVGFSFTTPEVNGTFNGWCGSCNAMIGGDMDGDGIWETTINLPNGDYEFKFSADNWGNQEALTDGSPCTVTTINEPDNFVNRTLSVTENMTYEAVWNACPVDCPADITGDGVININDFLAVNSNFGTNCTCASDLNGDGQVDINDFLILNSAFGTTCD